ncbi:chorion class B protein PC10-like [Pieris napi]|uniref:chorion class B protein PC10-like n=1 Tax=Pieris napi TaxID=78633 RepID=UPI001FB8EE0F|nr:chorion class B protein PC10-like [Pieris napi]
MNSKIVLSFFALMLVQAISGQCLNNPAWGQPAYGQAWGPMAAPWMSESYSPAMLSASNGCGLSVSSSSPIAPVGVSMASENAIEGPLAVAGQIPFLGAVQVDGALPTAGAGAISYGSGNGQVAILAEDIAGSYGAVAQGFAGPYRGQCGAYY